ncbi:unnamed protein product [Arabis nemorensis]|uniref:Uncharacterized protein n=1 Tax=Arabis nemorensis TaxID=586526 RepID=A0A565BCI1_9BRAS|nr:unnamed protein product [Arabis nemorensis]
MRIQVKDGPSQVVNEPLCLDDKRFDEDVFDGSCLSSLFEEPLKINLEVKAPKVTKDKPKEDKTTNLFLYPTQFIDGGIECKVKSTSGSKPFSKAKVILTPGLDEKELAFIKETMARVLRIEITDWGPCSKDGFINREKHTSPYL